MTFDTFLGIDFFMTFGVFSIFNACDDCDEEIVSQREPKARHGGAFSEDLSKEHVVASKNTKCSMVAIRSGSFGDNDQHTLFLFERCKQTCGNVLGESDPHGGTRHFARE